MEKQPKQPVPTVPTEVPHGRVITTKETFEAFARALAAKG